MSDSVKGTQTASALAKKFKTIRIAWCIAKALALLFVSRFTDYEKEALLIVYYSYHPFSCY